jgi:hypothetical protein
VRSGAAGLGFGLLLCAGAAVAESNPSNPYASSTDAELTSTAADWEQLSEDQRRALLTEMRSRMEAKNDGSRPVIEIRAQRRYGRLVRQPDGSVVRVETTEQIVRYGVPESSEASDRAYGTGFERRAIEGTVTADATTLGGASAQSVSAAAAPSERVRGTDTSPVQHPVQQSPVAPTPKPVLVDQPTP